MNSLWKCLPDHRIVFDAACYGGAYELILHTALEYQPFQMVSHSRYWVRILVRMFGTEIPKSD